MFLVKHRLSGALAALLVAALGALSLANSPATSCMPLAPPAASAAGVTTAAVAVLAAR